MRCVHALVHGSTASVTNQPVNQDVNRSRGPVTAALPATAEIKAFLMDRSECFIMFSLFMIHVNTLPRWTWSVVISPNHIN